MDFNGLWKTIILVTVSLFMLRIFISYSQEDFSGGARHVKNYMSRHVQDSDVFLDQSKTKGTKWRKEIDDKLETSNIFIVILTHGALKSQEVANEVQSAKKRKERRIIPCKENLLETDWNDIPWDLSEYDGISFGDVEELGRKLVTEIKRIRNESERIEQRTLLKGSYTISNLANQYATIDYEITNGELLSASADREVSSIIMSIASYDDGELKLKLPRSLIDAKVDADDDRLFILINGAESRHSEEISDWGRSVTISFKKGGGKIIIIGTQLFGISYSGVPKEENTIQILSGSATQKSDGRYLEPQTLTVKAGEKIRWINNDGVGHTVTSGLPSDNQTGTLFDSRLVSAGKTFEIVLNKKGTYSYFCQVHPWKTGKIVVV